MVNTDQRKLKVMVMAGGTGGHVFPALAVARELQSHGAEIMWLGTRRGLESEVIPAAGIPITFVNIAGLRGNGLLGWLFAPYRIAGALIQVIAGVRKFGPHVVLGLGGFVTGPGGIAAWLLRIPLVIHEQNAIAGLTNRLLAPFSKLVLLGFPNTFKSSKAIHTGNPVRADILALAGNGPKSNSDRVHLLIVGGSLGAKALNETVPNALHEMKNEQTFEVWHQTGKKLCTETQALYAKLKMDGRVEAFIEDMSTAYAWADLVVCRAGALTVAELAASGVAAILVPYPHAVDDHQTANARYLSENGAAILLQQSNLTPDILVKHLREIQGSALEKMRLAAQNLALPNATRVVAKYCMDVAIT
ncbi:MAG: undecaprenyldiphospho-muramoylpentapeptide beta-N-acetylglucosaminyltransferase [Thiohalomonadales bacterium]